MNALQLLEAHRYPEAIAECKRVLAMSPDDIGAIETMAAALRASGEYESALRLFQRVSAYEGEDKAAPGRPGRRIDMSCLYWFLGDRQRALHLMHDLVEGILAGSIKFSDPAGGVEQGLLLYYMSITENVPEEASFAWDYIGNRASRMAVRSWPGPIARYYLGDITFNDLLVLATGQRELSGAMKIARLKLLSRRRLCGVLFHDGVKNRAQGAEERCMTRMRECYGLENPLIEHEWYLARHEVEREPASQICTGR